MVTIVLVPLLGFFFMLVFGYEFNLFFFKKRKYFEAINSPLILKSQPRGRHFVKAKSV